jgi:hypothetical protein
LFKGKILRQLLLRSVLRVEKTEISMEIFGVSRNYAKPRKPKNMAQI